MRRVMTILVLLAAASVSPLIFPLAESGRSSMDALAKFVLLLSIAVIGIIWGWLHRSNDPLASSVKVGVGAGAIATTALEAIRLPGFWLHFMPGKSPTAHGRIAARSIRDRVDVGVGHRGLGVPLLERSRVWIDLRPSVRNLPPLGRCSLRRASRIWVHLQSGGIGPGSRISWAGVLQGLSDHGVSGARGFRRGFGLAVGKVVGIRGKSHARCGRSLPD